VSSVEWDGDDIRIREEDDDEYPCLKPEECGDWCWGFCYGDPPYGEEAAYV
jgi:hypothetical protein